MTKLLNTPVTIGDLKLKHRTILAPLTRNRANLDHVHTDLAVQYYAQRASIPGTLLITEGTLISNRAGGFDNVPGIYSQAQIDAWKQVTKAVHAKGSYIFCQLWALGRAADPAVLGRDGGDLIGPSAIPMSSDSETPRALSDAEIVSWISDYASAAKNAMEAGFDGVEIHGPNGYLCDQFLQDVSNNRTDQWGGSIKNRARFGIEVAKAVATEVGPERVGYRISPWSPFQGMKMANPVPQFTYLAETLAQLGLAYLHIVESRISGAQTIEARTEQADFLVDIWTHGAIILAGGFTQESADAELSKYNGRQVVIAFGRHFLANPDLPFRFQQGLSLNKYDRPTFYTPEDPVGYIDYPFSKEYLQLQTTAA